MSKNNKTLPVYFLVVYLCYPKCFLRRSFREKCVILLKATAYSIWSPVAVAFGRKSGSEDVDEV